MVTMLEKWRKALDKKEYICVLFMDLSETFFVGKAACYGFSKNALNLINLIWSYLKNRKPSANKQQLYYCYKNCYY